ncbi:acyltransferase family protein [Pseudonocardia nigra]|uniref:acyltransferase family protein n=1 Tax=Pseudonocardia nigra TaxID=1921578 RepID=UPI001C5F2A65|nr:acyltransferase family protein [Pseudonocardia nigra]
MASQYSAGGTATRERRLAWVDAAKGMAILLVVTHHAVMFLAESGQAPDPVVAANSALASLRMPLFFLASGLFAAGPLAASWRTLLHKRVAFFLYLYLLWTLLRWAFFTTVPEGVDPDDSARLEVLLWAPLLPGPSLWFLYALAVFSVLGKLVRRVPVALQLGATAVLSAVAGAGLLGIDSFAWTFMARYLFFFLVGCYARDLIERLARSTTPVAVVFAAAACVVGAGIAVALGLRSVPGVSFLLNVLAVVFGILFAALIVRFRVGRPLVALGQQTLPVYLIHMVWLALVMIGLRHVDLPVAVQYLAPPVLAVALTAVSLLTHRLLVKAGATWLFALPSRLAYRPARSAGGRSPANARPAA